MTFDELLKLAQDGNVGVCIDTRRLNSGDCFVAISGTNVDGYSFIDSAIDKGASFIVYDISRKVPTLKKRAHLIAVKDPARAAGVLAQASCNMPTDRLTSLAVTGTNGKTTTAAMVRAVVNFSGSKCGLIGTIENDICDAAPIAASMTTPDAVGLAAMMEKMVDNGAEFMCIEASSHSLDQRRLAGIKFKAAAFTNLTGDHLDYHKTMDNYLKAKSSLFEQLPAGSTAILNLDDESSKTIASACNTDILWYSVKDFDADIFAQVQSVSDKGCEYNLCFAGKQAKVSSRFCGLHNVSNQLAAAGLCIAAGISLQQIADGLSQFKNVPGRLERVDCGQSFAVFVDYAHTDDALANVLTTLKPLCKGRLITVFGCGGDRDKTKRPRMASVAEDFSDIAIVTSDNPRSEEPAAIIKDIKMGFDGDKCEVYIEPDREKAIKKAVEIAGGGDIILIAGKGHETYQIIGEQVRHFDDCEVVRNCLEKKGAI